MNPDRQPSGNVAKGVDLYFFLERQIADSEITEMITKKLSLHPTKSLPKLRRTSAIFTTSNSKDLLVLFLPSSS